MCNGVYYYPAYFKVAANRPLTLNRQDGSPCAKTVIFPAQTRETPSIGENAAIELLSLDVGEYAFHC